LEDWLATECPEMDFDPDRLPGSQNAAINGCTCCPKLNCGGNGIKKSGNYFIADRCPLHNCTNK